MANICQSLQKDFQFLTRATATSGTPYMTYSFDVPDIVFKVSIRTKIVNYSEKIITIKVRDVTANKTFKSKFDGTNSDTFSWLMLCFSYYNNSRNWICSEINKYIHSYLSGNWLSGRFEIRINPQIADNMFHAEQLYDAITNNNGNTINRTIKRNPFERII